jgi:Mn2+/Fe2+ NRAMP family transporter
MSKSINWKLVGPGIVLAAAGVGAGDIVASGVAGASFGVVLLWVLLIGAFFKYFLNEGMARYQLATGMTFMEGYTRVYNGFNYYFLVYLIIWSLIVGGALLSGIGLVSSVIFPVFSSETWGVISALIVLSVVYSGSYRIFERIMKVFALVMFVSFLFSAIMVFPTWVNILKGLFVPTIPTGKGFFDSIFKVLALMGGVGGTVTIMAYSYWIKENGIESRANLSTVRIDLAIGYFITFLFGMCVMILAAAIIHSKGGMIAGKQGIIDLAKMMSTTLGPFGFWIFIIGFWAAIFSSLMSFYQAIPYLFCDAIRLAKNKSGEEAKKIVNTKSWYYRGYVLYNVFPPMILLYLKKPVFLILCYSVLGAFFMPFLAFMLLIIGNHKELDVLKNKFYHNIVLILVFIVMTIVSFWPFIRKYFFL